jgi:hypothetical protein
MYDVGEQRITARVQRASRIPGDYSLATTSARQCAAQSAAFEILRSETLFVDSCWSRTRHRERTQNSHVPRFHSSAWPCMHSARHLLKPMQPHAWACSPTCYRCTLISPPSHVVTKDPPPFSVGESRPHFYCTIVRASPRPHPSYGCKPGQAVNDPMFAHEQPSVLAALLYTLRCSPSRTCRAAADAASR